MNILFSLKRKSRLVQGPTNGGRARIRVQLCLSPKPRPPLTNFSIVQRRKSCSREARQRDCPTMSRWQRGLEACSIGVTNLWELSLEALLALLALWHPHALSRTTTGQRHYCCPVPEPAPSPRLWERGMLATSCHSCVRKCATWCTYVTTMNPTYPHHFHFAGDEMKLRELCFPCAVPTHTPWPQAPRSHSLFQPGECWKRAWRERAGEMSLILLLLLKALPNWVLNAIPFFFS